MRFLNKNKLNGLRFAGRVHRKNRDSNHQQIQDHPKTLKTGLALPKQSDCIAHLRLLTAFAYLKEDVTQSGQDAETAGAGEHASTRAVDVADDPAWQQYIERAAARFEEWWQTVLKKACSNSSPLKLTTCLAPGGLESIMERTESLQWTSDMLPPLDVLMVLHTFMLNPRTFLEDCLRLGAMPLWKAGFPWRLVDRAITPGYEYSPGGSAQKQFEATTRLAWNNLYAQQDLGLACEGQPTLRRDQTACLDGLHRDIKALLEKDIPLPCTILSPNGRVQSFQAQDSVGLQTFLLNDLFKNGLGRNIVRNLDKSSNPPRDERGITLLEVESLVKNALENQAHARLDWTGTSVGVHLYNVFFHRLLSKYQGNPSRFSLNLADAVVRQGLFVSKMQEFDWVHSPGVELTVEEALPRYAVFFQIMALNYGEIAVPTYDVDLCWHTHQLEPNKYYDYSIAVTNGVFIDHDDKIGKGTLDKSFEWTSEQFSKLTGGEVYDECLCWLCFLEG